VLKERQKAGVRLAVAELNSMRRHLTTLNAELDGIGLRLLIKRREQLLAVLDIVFNELSSGFWDRILAEENDGQAAPPARKMN